MEIMNRNETFHVHTARCRHAGTDPDEAYVLEAIWAGADAIAFTDHAPFPGDRFRNRMLCPELPGYIGSLERLKEKYAGRIDVRIGLEIEWLPEYRRWIEALRADRHLDILLLGQHFYVTKSGEYSFETKDRPSEAEGVALATAEGIKTGLFDAVAHPDRAFRHEAAWTGDCARLSMEMIRAAKEQGIPLEINIGSMQQEGCFRPEFWKMYDGDAVIGLDAHSAGQLRWRACCSAFI